MSKKRESHEEHVNHERWLLTYADMITLLMIFFIVMYSMSIVDAKKFSSLAESLTGVLGSGNDVLNGTSGVMPGGSPTQNFKASEQQQLDAAVETVTKLIKDNNLASELTIVKGSASITIRVKDNLLFDSGSADLRIESHKTLNTIVNVILKLENRVRIEGYTDNIPIHSDQFDSNWELASQRAINVVKFFSQRGIDQRRLSAESFGEYKPLVPNANDINRQKNRRVDIVIIKEVK